MDGWLSTCCASESSTFMDRSGVRTMGPHWHCSYPEPESCWPTASAPSSVFCTTAFIGAPTNAYCLMLMDVTIGQRFLLFLSFSSLPLPFSILILFPPFFLFFLTPIPPNQAAFVEFFFSFKKIRTCSCVTLHYFINYFEIVHQKITIVAQGW